MPVPIQALTNLLGNQDLLFNLIETGDLEIELVPGADPFRPRYRVVHREGLQTLGLGSISIGIANDLWRRRRDAIFNHNIKDPAKPRIVAVGDSWFHYPFGSDLLEWFEDNYALKTFAAAGDVVSRMVAAKEYRQALTDVKPHFFMLSGGGNDLLGTDEQGARNIKHMVKRFRAGTSDVVTVQGRAKIAQVVQWFEDIRTDIAQHGFTGKMVVHGYDYASPPSSGPWLSEPLEEMGYLTEEHQLDAVKQLVDAFSVAIAEWAAAHPQVIHANCVGLNGRGREWWYNEIHPTMRGYRLRLYSAFALPMEKRP